MGNMILGDYTFELNPSSTSDIIAPNRKTAGVETYTSAKLFSWGVSMIGKTVDLEWEKQVSTEQFDEMFAICIADAPVPFDPQDGSGKVYTVEVLKCTGKYFVMLSGENSYRENVMVSLFFLDNGTVA